MHLIKKLLREDLEYFHVSDASPEQDEFEIGLAEDCEEDEAILEYIKKQLKEFNSQYPL